MTESLGLENNAIEARDLEHQYPPSPRPRKRQKQPVSSDAWPKTQQTSFSAAYGRSTPCHSGGRKVLLQFFMVLTWAVPKIRVAFFLGGVPGAYIGVPRIARVIVFWCLN